MSKYKQIVGECPECSGTTLYDLKNEIICDTCGLVISSPEMYHAVSLVFGDSIPKLVKRGSGIPNGSHVVSVVERVGNSMIYLAWDRES